MYSVRNIISLLLGFCLVSFQIQSIFAAALLFSDDPYQPDDKIMLKNVWEERNPLKKIKYTMLVYARPTVDIMKVTARKIITSFYELENFDATEYYMRIPTTNQRKKNLIDIVYKLWDQIKSDLVSRKSTLSYTQHVFYFKILKLFSEKISHINDLSQLKEKVNEEIKNFRKEGTIMPEWDNFDTVADLKEYIISDTDKCMEIFSIIQSSGVHGIGSTNIDFSVPESCAKVLEAPNQMLMYVDYVANVRENGTFKRIPLHRIYIDPYEFSLERLKSGLLLYYEALNEKFWKTIKPEDDAYEVISESIINGIKPIPQENYSEAFMLLNSLRENITTKDISVKNLVALYKSILHEADRKMRLLKLYLPELRKKKSRVMYYKLLHWLKSILKEVFKSCPRNCDEKSVKSLPSSHNEKNPPYPVAFKEVIEYMEEVKTREAKEIGQIEEKNIGPITNFDNLMRELNYFDRDDLDADTGNTIINPLEDDQNLGSNYGTSHNSSPGTPVKTYND